MKATKSAPVVAKTKREIKVGDKVKVLYAALDTHTVGQVLPVVRIEGQDVYLKGAKYPWFLHGTSLEIVRD